MGLNTQFPSWLQDQQQLNAQVGMQLGRNFMEGMKMAEDKRLNEAKMAEMRRMNDIQIQQAQAQIARENAITEGVINKNNLEALKIKSEADSEGVKGDFIAMQQKLYKMDGGLSNPEARLISLEFLKQNPQMARTQAWDDLEKQFAVAEKADNDIKRIRESGTYRILGAEAAGQSKIDAAKILADSRIQQAKLGRGLTPEELQEQGLSREEAVKMSQRLMEEKSPSGKAKWAVEDIAEGLKSNGIQFTDAEKSAARGSYGQSGVSLRAGPKLKENIMSESVSVEMLDGIQDRINKYEEDYGVSFNKSVGPIQNALRNLERYTTDPNSMSEQQREANSIFQSVNQLIQGYRKGNFGTALTENETKVFNGIVSQPNFSDYTERLNDFRNQISDKVGIEVRLLKFAPDIPMDVKVRFLKKGDTYVSPAQPATITGGKKVTVTAVPPGSRISPQQFQYTSGQQGQSTNRFTSGKYQIEIQEGQ